MVTQKATCNRCKEEIKNGGGYSVSATPGTWLTLDIVKGINPFWEHHYCGRQCLMLALNELADGLRDSPGITEPTARRFLTVPALEGERPDDAEPGKCGGGFYEDHIEA